MSFFASKNTTELLTLTPTVVYRPSRKKDTEWRKNKCKLKFPEEREKERKRKRKRKSAKKIISICCELVFNFQSLVKKRMNRIVD